jgi:glycosyltransferase involved in cell wall biosynthesis
VLNQPSPTEQLSAFFPAFNEAENIARTVELARDALEGAGVRVFELIVVNDGSTDRTGAIAEELAASDPRVRVVHHERNRGYGAALRTGFATSAYPWVFWTDGDGQFDVREIGTLFALAADADLVAGYRLRRADHFGRRVNGALWSALLRATLGLHARDVDCAFKLLRRSCLDRIPPLQSDGALVSAELLVKLERAGARRAQVGVHHYPRRAGEPTGADLRVIGRAFSELFGQRRQLRANAVHPPGGAF